MTLTIRDARLDEAALVWDLSRQLAIFEEMESIFVATVEDFRREMGRPDAVMNCLLAEVDGEVVASAVYFRTFSTFLCRPGIWLEELFVTPAFRRQGIAQALLDELRNRSEGRVEWEVLTWNHDAIALYEAYGASQESGWMKYRISPTDSPHRAV